jgi:isoquinoline 1-oxidoreductase beta subunit
MLLKPSALSQADAALTRRGFLQAGLAAGGALVVGFHLPLANAAQSAKTPFAPNAYIRIDAQGKVTLIMPQVEMGQGIYTSGRARRALRSRVG